MNFMFGRRAVATLAACALLSTAGAAEIDRAALYKHLPKALPFPPGVEFELKDLKPSVIQGFSAGTLEGRYKGRSQTWTIQISNDGRYYILSDAYVLEPSKAPGLLSAASNDPSIPQVHVAKDESHFFFGDMQDLTVDPDKANMAKIHLAGVPFKGTAGAPVAVIEYSDLECPFCRNAHLILEKELLPAYGKKIRWYFKHNPLVNIHPWAYPAAIAAACATRMKPEAGWNVESDFFKAQPDPNAPSKTQEETQENILKNFRQMAVGFAEKSGLDKARFTQCLEKQASKDIVIADEQEATALHLDSTPIFVVNGRIVKGFRDFESLKAVIDEMLAEQAGKH